MYICNAPEHWIDQPNNSHKAPVPYPTIRHSKHKCSHFCFELVHCGILDKCIMRFEKRVYWPNARSLHWRHNDHDGVSNHQPHGCLLNRLFRRRSKKTSKPRVTGLCVGNSPWPVNSPHKGPVTRKMVPFDDVIMWITAHSPAKSSSFIDASIKDIAPVCSGPQICVTDDRLYIGPTVGTSKEVFAGNCWGNVYALPWRHNEHDGVSNHQPHDCLLNLLFRGRSKKISKLRVTGLCAGNSPVTGEFPTQRASNAENVSIWWRHYGLELAKK